MEIRKAQSADFEEIMRIYAYARRFMAEHGNPKQWGATNWPSKALIHEDIVNGKSYLCVEDHRILAVFYYDYADDPEPTYHVIYEGSWKSDSPYGVVHRIASAEHAKGAGSFCLNWAFEQCGHLRIDTHADNLIMQNLLEKLGFKYCGIIHVIEDPDPRLAYEKISKRKAN